MLVDRINGWLLLLLLFDLSAFTAQGHWLLAIVIIVMGVWEADEGLRFLQSVSVSAREVL